MKLKITFGFFIALSLYSLSLSAQPYTLNQKIKPLKLQLTEHAKYKEAKYAEGEFTLNSGKTSYHFVKGHDVFQYVDIFIFANNEIANLQADLVFNTWNSIEETKHTSKSENGIINFKVRSWQDIGFKIKSTLNKNIDYTIIVNASEPVKNYLGSPFVKASEENLSTDTKDKQTATPSNISKQTNWLIYLVIGILLLLVGLLAGKLTNRNKTMISILFFSFVVVQTKSYGQGVGDFRDAQNEEINNTRRGQVGDAIDNVNQLMGSADAAEDLIRQYRNLGSCISSGPPPGRPRIPSFCPEESSCADCFHAARARFNSSRYNLEKLQIIYDCSTSYLNAAIAFGDNVSGYHGVSGIIWQSKKREIEKSMRDLDKAYDKKRTEMMNAFHENLMSLDECERAHGMEDWYDRFGVMFYNFAEMRYHR